MTIPDSTHVEVPSEIRRQAASVISGESIYQALLWSQHRDLLRFIGPLSWGRTFNDLPEAEQRKILMAISEGRCKR